MANTAGMSDEAMESMFSSSAPVAESNRKGTKTKKSLIRTRMETPIGTRAAARVTIPTKGRKISSSTNASVHDGDDSEQDHDEARIKMPPEPVVGQIIERRNNRSTKGQRGAVLRKSKQNQQLTEAIRTNVGFPSVNVPLGTFVNKTSNDNGSMYNPNQLGQPEIQSNSDRTTTNTNHQFRPSTNSLGNNNKTNNDNSESLRKIITQDAQGMLNEMSQSEILQSKKELQQSLSPDMIEFLKKRSSKKPVGVGNQDNAVRAVRTTKSKTLEESVPMIHESSQYKKEENYKSKDATQPNDDKIMNDAYPHDTTTSTMIDGDDQERNEKERLANILSSIKTYEDLDKAYIAEMDRQGLLGEDNVDSITSPSNVPLEHLGDDFAIACNLLRSTSKRQNLWAARVVCMKFQSDLDVEGNKYPLTRTKSSGRAQEWPYPVLLPVSLRCILDEPLTRTDKGVLHAYILQSIYALLLMRTPGDHVVDVRCSSDGKLLDKRNTSVIYQHYYMDDAIPKTPSREYYSVTTTLKPLASTVDENNDTTSFGVYSTSSSTTSATSDGEAFSQDPVWTLLSKMKIIPRLAQMLQWARRGGSTQESFMPDESVVSICGILSMIGQRSPGAASAVVQHSTLLLDLSYFSLNQKQNQESARYSPSLAIPFFVFVSTMARQSRVAAEALQRIDIDSILMQALAGMSTNEADYRMQQSALVLWRTLLCYGLSLSIIPTMLTLAVPHLTLCKSLQLPTTNEHQFSLSTEFYSCFTVIFHCVRSLQLAARQNNTDGNSNKNAPFPTADQMDILSNACVWLSSAKRQAVKHLMQIKISDLTHADFLTHFTSILRYLDSLLKITGDATVDPEEFKAEEISPSEEESCVDMLNTLFQSDVMKCMMDTVCSVACIADSNEEIISLPVEFDATGADTADLNEKIISLSVEFEASACACVESLLGLVTSFLKKYRTHSLVDGHSQVESKLNELLKRISDLLRSHWEPALDDPQRRSKQNDKQVVSTMSASRDLPRRHWFSSVHAAIVVFIHENGILLAKSLTRDIGWALLGRLELGDERTAATLLSYDDLFFDQSFEDGPPSMLSTVLLRELCGTPEAQKQLDHSFRLHKGPGIHASGLGPFKLDNLLSESDLGAPGSAAVEQLLPMGRFWPWKLLSGSVTVSESAPVTESIYSETSLILHSTFRMIKELESAVGDRGYAKSLNNGGKLYYLVNICLLPEQILSSDGIHTFAEQLFDFYFYRLDSESVFAFSEECCKSVSKTPGTATEENAPGNLSTSDEAKVKAILDSESFAESIFSHHAVRALLTFFGDLSEAFLDYGTTYTLFAKCIRLFLMKGFPTKVRCEVLRRLREVLHLLTLEEDDLVFLLKQLLLGGLPSVDNSIRDAPELLDILSLLSSKGSSTRSDSTLVTTFSVAALARSICINVQMGGTGLEVSKRRVKNLDVWIAGLVMETSFLFLATDGTIDSLIGTAYHVCGSKRTSHEWFIDIVDDRAWQNAICYIRESCGL